MNVTTDPTLPLVSFIVVNLNGRAHLEVLMDSIAAQTLSSDRLEVIVVDNGSSDESVSYLKTRHPHVKLLQNTVNEGFAKPNNQAAAIARGTYLALVNNDMKLEPDWVERMVEFMESSPPDVACVGSRILNWDGSAIDFIRGTMAYNGMGFQPGFQAPIDSPEARDYPDELLFACGGAMLIRREVFLTSGGFDEDYFAYYEDVDLGWRLWVLGYRVRFCPQAVVYHRHNGTSSRFDWRKKVVLFERNAMFSVVKNYEDATLNRIWPATLLLTFKRLAARSGIDRESFRFGPPPPRPDVAEAVLEPMPRKVLKNLLRLGIKPTVKKALVALSRKVLARWGGQVDETGASAPILREAYASVVGMEDFIDYLPKVLAKRREIQARRRRSDADIFRVFASPLEPVEGRPAYVESHWLIAQELGLKSMFTREEVLK